MNSGNRGRLARRDGEASEGSDADWVLLVDGPSDPEHAMLARGIEKRVRAIVPKDVGPTGTFGDIVASHELVHDIAGTRDSNENLTRRILLLSESRALTNPVVRERVIRNILARYVLHDRSVRSRSGRRQVVPHFLLNDVVRYWRTMASDYASKMWERSRQGWGIRNVKLRFSRKLLFVWGLLAAFAGDLFALADLIRSHDIFSSYDQFLHALADPDARARLEAVRFEDALDDPTYAGLRDVSQRFRRGVTRLFFDVHPRLPTLIRDFGVF